jgi:hypothetical protein
MCLQLMGSTIPAIVRGTSWTRSTVAICTVANFSTCAHAETRSSKNKQKRHPDKICAKLSDSKWESWITSTGGKALWQCVTQLRSKALHEDCSDRVECWHGRDMTVEISVTSATEMQMRLSPMIKVTNFMENKPLVSQGEFITVSSSEAQKLKHDTDTMCHEECFFATNALSKHSAQSVSIRNENLYRSPKSTRMAHARSDICVPAAVEDGGCRRMRCPSQHALLGAPRCALRR